MTARSNLHTAWSDAFVAALVASGLRDVVVSPGSRSTPLALALARCAALRTRIVVDERAAAFEALGQARVTGAPSMLLCTSGTAAAHYLPAVIEASQAHLPMLVVSTDRPWEAYDCAAPQTIDQTDLFGRAVRHRAELGLPDPSPDALAAVARIAAQSMARTRWPTPGPAHVNARFRKPLEPVPDTGPEPWTEVLAARVTKGPARFFTPASTPSPEGVRSLASSLADARRPVFVCGPSIDVDDADAEALHALAARLGAPVVAESASGHRHVGASSLRLAHLDAALRSVPWSDAHRPDVVVAFGLPPTSPAVGRWIAGGAVERWVVAAHGWPDPGGDAFALLPGSIGAVARGIEESFARPAPRDEAWLADLRAADGIAAAAVRAETFGPTLDELTVAQSVVDALPAGAVLVAGNSMPVRDLEFATPRAALRVLHQRGASGIDGIIAGAVGARSVTDAAVPVLALLGDVTAAHDLGGLNVARDLRGALVVVIVQNGGGRIFAELPIGRTTSDAAAAEVFARFFLTPQDVRWDHAAAAFGHAYAVVSTPGALAAALATATARDGLTVIEAVVPPEDGGARRARIWARVAEALAR